MRKIKFFVIAIISFGLLSRILPVVAKTDFGANESYYKSLCTVTTVAKKDKETCRDYAQWLEQKVNNAQADINKYKGEINKHKDDLAKQVEIAEGYEIKIREIEIEIINEKDKYLEYVGIYRSAIG